MNRNIKILLVASSFFMLAGGLFGPIYAIFVEEIGGDLLTAGAAYSIFAITAGVIIYFISKWEDKIKYKKELLIGSYALSCIGFLGYLFIQSPIHLFLVQIVFGIGDAIGTPLFDGLYSKNIDEGKDVSEWGAWESLNYIFQGIAALVGGYIALKYGFRPLFVIMLVLSIFGLGTSILLVKYNHIKKNGKKNKKNRKKK
ncbi:MFS transporter [archaeon]|jgi:MFS family permease|nr:MFS transporter [archaeon]MBT3731346.1 MFS transporter [archaeon]MBT4670351.1 MFS transporter [archaeon]MBT5029631.1 MFS transporter [archaeon]MBT5287620.1 MFS transporter [archaeon]